MADAFQIWYRSRIANKYENGRSLKSSLVLNLLHAIHNVVPKCTLIKMGSMGEYGMPNIPITEGFIDIEYKGRKDVLPFPKHAFTDWYHWSKVHDSDNVMLACEIWNLRRARISGH